MASNNNNRVPKESLLSNPTGLILLKLIPWLKQRYQNSLIAGKALLHRLIQSLLHRPIQLLLHRPIQSGRQLAPTMSSK
jgi:hypothetical protein